MNHSIDVKSVGHYFGRDSARITLFDGLSLTFSSGRSYAIVGPSGAGKSSLLTLAAGLETPRTGSVTFQIDGQVVPCGSFRRNIGFIFQQFHLLPELDAIGNLALPLRLRGDKEAYDKARHWLDKVGLSDRAHHRPSQLSGGEQQRIAIARAFVAEPKFVFADEPTGNLDEKTSSGISDLMFEIGASQNCGLILVTHSATLAKRADQRYQLSQGQLELVS